jgi:ubiquinone/menaquinone biosynthesis C-methylase UbiE
MNRGPEYDATESVNDGDPARMDEAEFDKFADEYRELHAQSIALSGEAPEFFAEYKVRDTVALAHEMGLTPGLRILDFGAGPGNSIPHFRRFLSDCDLTCLDVSRKCLAVAQRRFPGKAHLVAFDGVTIPFPDRHFSVAFSACVFHHIPRAEHQRLLSELLRVLKPGGFAAIFEHNPFNPLTRQAVRECPFDDNAILVPAHALVHEMKSVGFAHVRQRYRVFFPRQLRLLRTLEPYLTWLPLGAQYYVAADRPRFT